MDGHESRRSVESGRSRVKVDSLLTKSERSQGKLDGLQYWIVQGESGRSKSWKWMIQRMKVNFPNDFPDESQYQTSGDKGRTKSGHLCLVLGRTDWQRTAFFQKSRQNRDRQNLDRQTPDKEPKQKGKVESRRSFGLKQTILPKRKILKKCFLYSKQTIIFVSLHFKVDDPRKTF